MYEIKIGELLFIKKPTRYSSFNNLSTLFLYNDQLHVLGDPNFRKNFHSKHILAIFPQQNDLYVITITCYWEILEPISKQKRLLRHGTRKK